MKQKLKSILAIVLTFSLALSVAGYLLPARISMKEAGYAASESAFDSFPTKESSSVEEVREADADAGQDGQQDSTDTQESEGEQETEVDRQTDEEALPEAEGEEQVVHYPRTLTAEGKHCTVKATISEDAQLPEDVELQVTPIDPKSARYQVRMQEAQEKLAEEAGKNTELDFTLFQLYDIAFVANGQEIEPAAPVQIVLNFMVMEERVDPENANVIHFDEEQGAEIIENPTVKSDKNGSVTAEFEAQNFSEYAVYYTVDFYNNVDGKTYDFSIPGGGFVRLTDLIETLGIQFNDGQFDVDQFVADIKSVDFSDSSLVWVGKMKKDSTIGQMKRSLGLDCEYSADLTKEQIEEMNNTEVTAGEWIVLSLKPFTSEETLTVTMKNGDVFTVKVTDAQISTDVLAANGETYTITVNYDDGIEIPAGTRLTAREIEQDSDEFNQDLGRTWSELNREYFKAEKQKEDDEGRMGELPDNRMVNVNAARFFQLTLTNAGKVIELGEPVSIEIRYADGPVVSKNLEQGIVCFSSDNTSLIEEIETNPETETADYFRFKTDSLSTVGTYIAQETHDMEEAPRKSVAFSHENRTLDAASIPMLLRGARSGESEYTNDDSELPHPTGDKTLVPNDDGTYTLTLSVKGKNQPANVVKNKANVLFVMDRSSSMITNKIDNQDSFWYYGVWGTDYTFRGDIKPSSGYQFYGVVNGNYVQLNCNYEWDVLGQYGNYRLTYWNGSKSVNYPVGGKLYVNSKTTRLGSEQTVLNGLIESLLDQNTAEVTDNAEVAIISFGDHRFDTKAWSSDTEESWTGGNDASGLESVVNSPRYTSGTNWEEALQYALEVIRAKKTKDGAGEDYYVVFLTDGEPTNVEGDTSAAAYTGDGPNGNIYAYDCAKDEARTLVQEGYKFYNIFTYRTTESDLYSRYLTNYAYTGVDRNDDGTSDACKNYYTDARTTQDLVDALSTIFEKLESFIAHGNVRITDTLTTDAMTTTLTNGEANGYIYTVKGPDNAVLYTVTATGALDDPSVTFHVLNPEGEEDTDYPAVKTVVNGKTCYSVTVNDANYSIALADVNNTTGELVWDLSPVGTLMNDCTYSVSFIVWPNQDAYDFVAALNNGLDGYHWNETEGGIKVNLKGETEASYPSVVKNKDGVYAVQTNTDQKIHYSVIRTSKVNGVTEDVTVTGPYYRDLELPDPMPLEDTKIKVQKVWNDSLDPSQLNDLVNNAAKKFAANLVLKQGEDDYIDGIVIEPVRDSEGSVKRTWTETDENGNDVEHFISAGLMVSTTAAKRSDLYDIIRNNTAFKQVTYGTEVYFILDTGYNYQFQENTSDPHFELAEAVYHPMSVDGVLMNVTFSGATITGMVPMGGNANMLTATNDLKGGVQIYKKLFDADGNDITSNPNNKKFYITVKMTNPDDTNTPYTVRPEDGGYRIYYGPNNPNRKEPVYDTDGTTILNYGRSDERYGIGSGTFTAEIYAGDYIQIGNVDRGVNYEVTENSVPAGYELMDIVYNENKQSVTSNKSNQVKVMNTLRSGNLNLAKAVTINGFHPDSENVSEADRTKADGTFTFYVNGKEGTPTGGISHVVRITIQNGQMSSAEVDGSSVPLQDGYVVFDNLKLGEYVITEDVETNAETVCTAISCSDNAAVTTPAELTAEVPIHLGDDDNVTFTNNYTNSSGDDVAHVSVRKTFVGLDSDQIPDNFSIPVTINATINGKQKEMTYTLTNAQSQPDGVFFSNTNENGRVIWNWRIAIPGLKPDATVTISENGQAVEGYSVTSTLNGLNQTTSVGTVSAATVVQDMTVDVITANNRKTFPVYDYGDSSKIFMARLTSDKTTLVISKNRLTLSEKAVIESMLKTQMPQGGDWTHGNQVLYYNFEEAAGNQIIVKGKTVTYSDTNGGQITFDQKCQWSMVGTGNITYQPGRPADFNFVNSYKEKEIGVDVVKVDRFHQTTKLPGAVFRLRQIADKVPEEDGTMTSENGMYEEDSQLTAETTGLTSFAGLTSGYYEMTEKTAPEGYLLSGDTAAYFKIEGGVVTWLEKGADKPSTWSAKSSKEDDELVSFSASAAVDAQNVTFTVENIPAYDLPSAGGPGTYPFTIIGVAIGATALLLLSGDRRRVLWRRLEDDR